MKNLIIWISILTIGSISIGIAYPRMLILTVFFLFMMCVYIFAWVLNSTNRVRQAIFAAARGDYPSVRLALGNAFPPLFPSIRHSQIVDFLLAKFTDKEIVEVSNCNAQWQSYVVVSDSGQKLLSEAGVKEFSLIIENQGLLRQSLNFFRFITENRRARMAFLILFILSILARTAMSLLQLWFHQR